jgi:UDP-N-acetylglucosamine 4,6-dehydratase
MQGGEIFVPKIPSMRLVDLADVLAPGICKETIGIRPGEKLHECLITAEEARHAREYDGFYVIEPEHSFWKKDDGHGGKPLPDGFCYTSDSNGWWLTGEELKKMVESLDDYAKQGKVN